MGERLNRRAWLKTAGVAALGAAAAVDEAGLVERGEHLVEVGLGDALAHRDVGGARGAAGIASQSEIHEGPHAIVYSHGNTHGFHLFGGWNGPRELP